MKKRLAEIDAGHTEIRLVDCVDDTGHPNLAVTALEPEEGIRLANMRWRMKVTVEYDGPVHRPQGAVRLDGRGKPPVQEFPSTRFRRANRHRKALRRDAPDGAGPKHGIAVHLEPDAVDADNHRFAVVDLPVEVPVLLVYGSTQLVNSRRAGIRIDDDAGRPAGMGYPWARRIEAAASTWPSAHAPLG